LRVIGNAREPDYGQARLKAVNRLDEPRATSRLDEITLLNPVAQNVPRGGGGWSNYSAPARKHNTEIVCL
jgi:hypothetical protein